MSTPPKIDPYCATPMPHERAQDHRGHNAHAHCARPVAGISLWRLWIRPVRRPVRCRTRGGASDGSDPPFTCLVRHYDPVCLRTSGGVGPHSPLGGRSRLNDPCRKARNLVERRITAITSTNFRPGNPTEVIEPKGVHGIADPDRLIIVAAKTARPQHVGVQPGRRARARLRSASRGPTSCGRACGVYQTYRPIALIYFDP